MSKLLCMPELFAALAAGKLRKMDRTDYDGFAGVKGEGYILEGEDAETIAVFDVTDEKTVVQVFNPELEPIAAEYHMIQTDKRSDIPKGPTLHDRRVESLRVFVTEADPDDGRVTILAIREIALNAPSGVPRQIVRSVRDSYPEHGVTVETLNATRQVIMRRQLEREGV